VERHPFSHDSGIVKDGPELVRSNIKKNAYSKVLLLWDQQGSGWEKLDPLVCQEKIMTRLRGVSWKDHSAAIVICPELEEWLWHDPSAIQKYLQLAEADFSHQVTQYAKKTTMTIEAAKSKAPKELLQHLFSVKLHKSKVLPAEFSKMAGRANLKTWRQSASFRAMAETLQAWFPGK
jgi:hypothetical protein